MHSTEMDFSAENPSKAEPNQKARLKIIPTYHQNPNYEYYFCPFVHVGSFDKRLSSPVLTEYKVEGLGPTVSQTENHS